jgi:hypothetical protein
MTNVRLEMQRVQLEIFQGKEKLADLRRKIIQGDSTGDRVMDFHVVHYGFPEGKLYNSLQQLNLNLHKGVEVLVTNHLSWSEGRAGVAPPPTYNKFFRRFGILSENPVWDFERGLVLPMEHHAWTIEVYEWNLGSWSVLAHSLRLTRNELQNHQLDAYDPKRDDVPSEVISWRLSAGRGAHGIHESMNVLVGKEVESWFDMREQKGNKKSMPGYNEAQLCVRNGTTLRAYNEKIEQELKEKRQSLLAIIDIATLPRRADDDVLVALLTEAVGLNLHKDGGLLQGNVPGIQIQPAAYITSLCKEYGIKL